MYCRVCLDSFLDELTEIESIVAYLEGCVNKRKEEDVKLFIYGPSGSGKSALCMQLQIRDDSGMVQIQNSIDIVFPFIGDPGRKDDNPRKLCMGLSDPNERMEESRRVLIMEDIHLLDQVWEDFAFSSHQLSVIINHNRNMIITSQIPMQSLPIEVRTILSNAGFKELVMEKLGLDSKKKIIDCFALQYHLTLYRDVRDTLLQAFDEDLDQIKEFLWASKPYIDKKRYRLKMQTLGRIMGQFYGNNSEYVKKVRRIIEERNKVQNDKCNF